VGGRQAPDDGAATRSGLIPANVAGGLLMRAPGSVGAKLYLFAVAVLLTSAIGVSRIYLGVHWPTDVLAGWGVGAAWAPLFLLVAVWLERWRDFRAASHSPSAD